MKYYLIAGEASGDLHASKLMVEIKRLDHEADFRFFGGEKMAEVGGTLVRHYKDTAVMGFLLVLLNIVKILKNIRLCKEDILQYAPDRLILVDYPGFNLKIAKYVFINKICSIYYYIPPKVWAWKEGRAKYIKKYIHKVISILPFEVDYYKRKHQLEVEYVGNPTKEQVEDYVKYTDQKQVKDRLTAAYSINWDKKIVTLMPGSRKQEITNNLSIMLETLDQFNDIEAMIIAAPNIADSFYSQIIGLRSNIHLVHERSFEILQISELGIITSGTATLEAALVGTPQIVCYHMSGGKIAHKLYRMLVPIPNISLVNIILGRKAVPELIVDEMNPSRLKKEISQLLYNPSGILHQKKSYLQLSELLGSANCSINAARIIING